MPLDSVVVASHDLRRLAAIHDTGLRGSASRCGPCSSALRPDAPESNGRTSSVSKKSVCSRAGAASWVPTRTSATRATVRPSSAAAVLKRITPHSSAGATPTQAVGGRGQRGQTGRNRSARGRAGVPKKGAGADAWPWANKAVEIGAVETGADGALVAEPTSRSGLGVQPQVGRTLQALVETSSTPRDGPQRRIAGGGAGRGQVDRAQRPTAADRTRTRPREPGRPGRRARGEGERKREPGTRPRTGEKRPKGDHRWCLRRQPTGGEERRRGRRGRARGV